MKDEKVVVFLKPTTPDGFFSKIEYRAYSVNINSTNNLLTVITKDDRNIYTYNHIPINNIIRWFVTEIED